MIEWILTFFAFPIVFWILFCFMGIWLFWMTIEEEVGPAFFPIVLGLLLAWNKFASVGEFFRYLWNNPWDILLYFLCYMIVGTLWSLFKWMLYVHDCAKAKHSKPDLTQSNKEKIISWIILWIPSMIIFLAKDPVRRLANWIYARMTRMYQGITDYAYRNVTTK